MNTTNAPQRAITRDGLALFLQEIITEYESYKASIRRTDNREAVSIPVEAQCLDDQGKPVGEPFHMVTRDISSGGLGMFHAEFVECGSIQLSLTSPVTSRNATILANVEHCTPCGKYFIVGCQFLRAGVS